MTRSLSSRCRLRRRTSLAAALGLFATSALAQATAANACDLNGDGVVNVADINLAVNMALGAAACTANIEGPGVCDVVIVQRVTNAALGGNCVTGNPHTVALTWVASVSANVAGYNVYRGSVSGGPYTKVNASLIAGTSYTDTTVPSSQTFYYVATAVDTSGDESVYSNEIQAVVPN
jgi:hypothetical protein